MRWDLLVCFLFCTCAVCCNCWRKGFDRWVVVFVADDQGYGFLVVVHVYFVGSCGIWELFRAPMVCATVRKGFDDWVVAVEGIGLRGFYFVWILWYLVAGAVVGFSW